MSNNDSCHRTFGIRTDLILKEFKRYFAAYDPEIDVPPKKECHNWKVQ